MAYIKIKRKIDNVKLPYYATDWSSGLDLHASEGVTIEPFSYAMVRCGIAIEIVTEEGDGDVSEYELQVRSRSGIAANGVFVLNAPGIIDSDYRGEIKAILGNLNNVAYNIEVGMRICQITLFRTEKIKSVVNCD